MLVASQVAAGKPQIRHYPHVPDDERLRTHGAGIHTPFEQLTVSEATTVMFEWRIGRWPVTTGGEFLVVWRWPFDWSDLQSLDPLRDGFMCVAFLPARSRSHAPADVEFSMRYNWIAGIEPWHHQLQVRVVAGELQEGDRVQLTCGETSEGGGGWRAPTCVADRCEFLMLIDHRGDGVRSRLVQQPGFRVVSGEPVTLAAVSPSDAVVSEPVMLIVRAEDCWGNPTNLSAPVTISAVTGDSDFTVESVDTPTVRPVSHFQVTFLKTGVIQLKVTSGEFTAVTGPITIRQTAPPQQLFWGDLHSGQTEIGCGCGSMAEAYAFGRDCAGLQFITHQANDHYVTLDDWNHTRDVTREFYAPGRYVTFLGCEWSPLTKDGGDRNVIYRDDDPTLRRSDRFFREDVPDPEPDIPTAPDFHRAFRDRDVLVNIHVGGRMTNLEWYEPQIEKLCETHSTHGTVEWFFMEALRRGYRVGLTAGTDGVMGRPGADHPGRRLIRNLRNGLTAVYAQDLTRESIWEALQARRCYATTGERIRVWLEVDGHPMGSECTLDSAPHIVFCVHGTQAIERVDLFRGVEVIQSWDVAPPMPISTAPVIRILWGGTERKGTARLQRVDWSGSLTASAGTSLELLDTVNFQSYDDNAHAACSGRIEWSSQSAGNAAGILVRVSGNLEAELYFDTDPLQVSFRPADVIQNTRRIAAGGVNRFVEVGTPPDASGPREFVCETVDNDELSGEFPYWLRVTQVDQSLAWSSPVYVTRRSSCGVD